MKTNKSCVVPNQAHWGFCRTPEDFALMNCCLLYTRQIVVKDITTQWCSLASPLGFPRL